MHNTTW